ncbi:MAG: hypothetical protein EOP84_19105 [Verrucomicrobiaceae bacterium]|nr:MAG: hypothetical protein EOP84_19105 [Verrucomicrobiaceae bacterium]
MRTPPLAILLSSALLFAQAPANADPYPLKRGDAKKIIESLGYKNPQIAYIVHGLNTSTVSGMGVFKGEVLKFDRTMRFDEDLGWFYSEDRPKDGMNPPSLKNIAEIRIWTVEGYSEVGVKAPQEVELPADLKTALIESLGNMDGAFQDLLEKLTPAQRAAFIADTDAWNAREEGELAVIAATAGPEGSPQHQLAYSRAKLSRNENRLKLLQQYIADPSKAPGGK